MSVEPAPQRGFLSSPLNRLPRPVKFAQRPVAALGTAWLLTFPISIVVAMILAAMFPDAAQPQFPFEGFDLFWRIVFFAPAVETLIMGVVLLILRLFMRPTPAVLVTAILAGLAHSYGPNGVAIWGLVIWWPFLIFSTLFVVWRERSVWAAFGMAALAHALHNLPSAALIVSGINV